MYRIPIKQLLKKYNVRPSKGLGQNFLIDNRVLEKIVAAAELKPNDVVLEVGPGPGNLTFELAKRVHPVKSAKGGVPLKAEQFNRVKKVIAVEKDPKMCEILKETLKKFRNVEIIQGDILKLFLKNPKSEIRNPKQILNSKFQIPNRYKVVTNLPYYITSPVIRKFLEMKNQPILMVLMVQKEVAQRICAKPPNMSILAVSVQFYAKPEIIAYISKKCFWPQPKVDSAIIKITPFKNGRRPALLIRRRAGLRQLRQLFFRIVKVGFLHPRKQLLNNLSQGLKLNKPSTKILAGDKEKIKEWLFENNIQPNQRAETLTIEDWLNLAKSNIIKENAK